MNAKRALVLIIIVAAIFRFYNFKNFQYWSADEEIATAIVRRIIVDKKFPLISPNTTISASLGPYFHLLSVPLFIVAQFNPVYVLLPMGFIGVVTAYLIFLIGKEVKNIALATSASLLYSASFVMALFDRRWWPLSLNAFLTTLAFFSLYKIAVSKQYWFSVPLAVAMSFALHADPSLGIIAISAAFAFLVFKIPIFKKQYILALVVVVFFVLPLVLFEIRHPGTILKPLSQSLQKGSAINPQGISLKSNFISDTLNLFGRLLMPVPTNFAEVYVASGFSKVKPLLSPIPQILVLIFLVYPLLRLFSLKKYNNEKTFLLLSYIFLSCFALLSFLFSLSIKHTFHQHYFTVIFPIFFLLAGYTLTKIITNPKILFSILGLILIVNTLSLTKSAFRYPLYQKVELVSSLSKEIGSSNFSFYALGDEYFVGGGLTELFILNNKHPKKSYIYPFYDWMYQAYSLYTVKPETWDQEKIVIVKNSINSSLYQNIIYKTKSGNMEAVILDNSTKWFDQTKLR